MIDRRLGDSAYIAGDEYSIADIAIFPWLRNWENQGIVLADYPNLKRWFDKIAAAPGGAARREGAGRLRKPITDDKEREILFGKTQYEWC